MRVHLFSGLFFLSMISLASGELLVHGVFESVYPDLDILISSSNPKTIKAFDGEKELSVQAFSSKQSISPRKIHFILENTSYWALKVEKRYFEDCFKTLATDGTLDGDLFSVLTYPAPGKRQTPVIVPQTDDPTKLLMLGQTFKEMKTPNAFGVCVNHLLVSPSYLASRAKVQTHREMIVAFLHKNEPTQTMMDKLLTTMKTKFSGQVIPIYAICAFEPTESFRSFIFRTGGQVFVADYFGEAEPEPTAYAQFKRVLKDFDNKQLLRVRLDDAVTDTLVSDLTRTLRLKEGVRSVEVKTGIGKEGPLRKLLNYTSGEADKINDKLAEAEVKAEGVNNAFQAGKYGDVISNFPTVIQQLSAIPNTDITEVEGLLKQAGDSKGMKMQVARLREYSERAKRGVVFMSALNTLSIPPYELQTKKLDTEKKIAHCLKITGESSDVAYQSARKLFLIKNNEASPYPESMVVSAYITLSELSKDTAKVKLYTGKGIKLFKTLKTPSSDLAEQVLKATERAELHADTLAIAENALADRQASVNDQILAYWRRAHVSQVDHLFEKEEYAEVVAYVKKNYTKQYWDTVSPKGDYAKFMRKCRHAEIRQIEALLQQGKYADVLETFSDANDQPAWKGIPDVATQSYKQEKGYLLNYLGMAYYETEKWNQGLKLMRDALLYNPELSKGHKYLR
ncbi:MAG: hypothetical protein RRC34_05220 [Lentisphaeria bacterium]|nr:hypothetical protein [Lentisphaeria bacterium]